MENFDDLRPYTDAEIPSAMERIASDENFGVLADFVFPQKSVDEVRQMVREIRTIGEFQRKVMYAVNKQIISRTTEGFSYGGIQRLSPEKSYLFVSNHRDIMLDASFLQQVFYEEGFPTSEITFGSNLMSMQLVIDIGKSNKMFRVERKQSASLREFAENSRHLSAYMRYAIAQKRESLWIAQRNGRTKDGNDATDQGIVKMFCMSGARDLRQSLAELNVVPVAVSYEIEPCDKLKMRELYLSRGGKTYTKAKGEDLNSILTGVLQQKGRVHFEVCEPVSADDLAEIDTSVPNMFFKKVAELLDERILRHYKLFPANFIAYDLREGEKRFAEKYSAAEREKFVQRQENAVSEVDGDKNILREIFLGIYANPIANKLKMNLL